MSGANHICGCSLIAHVQIWRSQRRAITTASGDDDGDGEQRGASGIVSEQLAPYNVIIMRRISIETDAELDEALSSKSICDTCRDGSPRDPASGQRGHLNNGAAPLVGGAPKTRLTQSKPPYGQVTRFERAAALHAINHCDDNRRNLILIAPLCMSL